jgi:hypothetical protein
LEFGTEAAFSEPPTPALAARLPNLILHQLDNPEQQESSFWYQ